MPLSHPFAERTVLICEPSMRLCVPTVRIKTRHGAAQTERAEQTEPRVRCTPVSSQKYFENENEQNILLHDSAHFGVFRTFPTAMTNGAA